jgi:serine/threonine-protein kinase RsbW
MKDSYDIVTSATREEIPKIAEFIEGAMTSGGFSHKDILEVQLVVEEACTNIIMHGYVGRGVIHITCNIYPEQLIATIEDWGCPFDPTKGNPTPYTIDTSQKFQTKQGLEREPSMEENQEELPIGGLGIFLMKNFVDSIFYQFKGEKNILTICKKMAK